MKAKDLKKSILQLAIQGKLVPQDPKDEPASKLLDKIRAAKQKLIQEGKLKKEKVESVIYKGDDNNYYEKIGQDIRNITDEIPFEIPDSWAWVRIGDISTVKGGKRVPKGYSLLDNPTSHIYIRVTNMKENTLIPDKLKYISDEIFQTIKNYVINKDDLYLTIAGTIGEAGIVPTMFNNMNLTENAVKLTNIQINKSFLLKLLQSPAVQYQFHQKTNKVAQPKLAIERILSTYIPLPPLKEQERIVSRIATLDPFVDDYDQAETELSTLNNSFPEQIKKSILQYAIQGKLVPQDPKDEPASVLLEKIKAEKLKLIKAGKIKKDKQESYIYKRDNRHYEKIGDKEIDITDEIPFEIPDSWAWVRLKNLVHYHMGKTPQRKNEQFWEKGTFPWVSIADLVSDGILGATKEKISVYALSQIFKGKISPKGTLLMSFKLTVGKVSILNINAVHNEAIISIYPYLNTDNIIRDYLFKFMPLLSQEGHTKTAIKGKTLNSDSIDALLIPLPPLGEQNRIVAKVEELLKLLPND